MRRATGWILLAGLVLGMSVLGCAQPEREMVTAPRTSPPPPPPRTPPPMRTEAPPTTPEPPPTQGLTPPATEGPCSAVGLGLARVYMPLGKTPGSPLLVERTAPRQVRVGDAFAYEMKVTNVTDTTLHDVRVHESWPNSLSIKQLTPPPTETKEGEATWLFPTLQAGQSAVIKAQAAATATGQLRPCISVTYQPKCLGIAIDVVQPQLQLVKSAPAEALVCEVIPIELVVRNAGTGRAANVVVRDPLPKGLMTLDGKTEILLTVGDLDAGQARKFEAKLKAAAGGKYVNEATATADGGLTATAAPVTTVVHEPKLTVAVTGPQKLYAGRPITYTIKVTNAGEVAATNTVLTNAIPAGAAFVKASSGGALRDNAAVWNLGTIPVGEAKEVTLTVQADQPGVVRTTAVARAVCVTAQAAATTTAEGIPAILLETVDLVDPIEVGANETYVITVTNQGSAVATNVKIVATLPDEQEYVSSTGPTRATADGKVVTFAPLAQLAPKAKAEFRIIARGIKAGSIRFKIDLTSDWLTTPVSETESTHIYE